VQLGKKNDVYENILLPAKQTIRNLISKTQTDVIVIEDIQQQNQNVDTYKKLAMLMGVLLCLFNEIDKPYEIVPPSRWKSYCEIKGKRRSEQKENTLIFAKDKFALDDITEDKADAVSLGWFAANKLDS